MEAIIDKIEPQVPLELKQECLKLINEHKNHCSDLNMRTLIKAIKIRIEPENGEIWKDMVLYSMTSTVN